MPRRRVNEVGLYYEIGGRGDPLVLVHGSWTDHTSWRFVTDSLAESHRVLTYDRRGHSRSERPDGPGSRRADIEDLAALVEVLGLTPHPTEFVAAVRTFVEGAPPAIGSPAAGQPCEVPDRAGTVSRMRN
jgi:pimeloyl-ACP methyl ester carboxylesterase